MKIKRAEAEDIWKMVALEGADARGLASALVICTISIAIKGADAEALRPLSLMRGNK